MPTKNNDIDLSLGVNNGQGFTPSNLPDFMKSIEINNQNLLKRSDAAQQIFEQQAKDAADMLQAQSDQGSSAKVVLAAKEYAGLEAQNKVQSYATRMGINPGESSEVLDKIADEWKASQLDAITKRQNLKNDLEINPLEHPIDYVVAQVKMENTVNQLEAANNRAGQATKSFSDLQTLTQALPAQMNALAKTKSDATIQATLEGFDAGIKEKLMQTKINNAQIDQARLNALGKLDQDKLTNLTTAMSVHYQDEQNRRGNASLALQQQASEQSAAEFVQRTKIQNAQLDDMIDKANARKDDRAAMQDMVDTVKYGAKTMGIDLPDMPASKVITLLNNKEGKFYDFYKAGINSLSADRPVISNDAGDAARLIVQHQGQFRPEQKPVVDLLRESWQEGASPTGAIKGGYSLDKKDQVLGAVRSQAVSKATAEQALIKPGDATNIYAAPPLPTVLEAKGVKDTRWYTEVMAPQMVTSALKDFNPEQLIALTATAIKNKTITQEEAVKGLQNTFGAAALTNNATKNYRGFGLPEQTSFNTRMPDGNGLDRKYNLMTPQDITRALSNKLNSLSGAGRILD